MLPPPLPPLRSTGSSSSNHMVPRDTPWVLGECQGPAVPSGAGGGGPFASPPLPGFPWHGFLHEFPYHASASASPSWPATPVLHYPAENNTHPETGKLYFIRQPRSAPEKPLELIHCAAFDSLLLRGWVEVLGALREGLPRGLSSEVWAQRVTVVRTEQQELFRYREVPFLSKLSVGNDVIKVTWRGIGGRTMVRLLWHLRSTLLVGPAYNLKYMISFKVA